MSKPEHTHKIDTDPAPPLESPQESPQEQTKPSERIRARAAELQRVHANNWGTLTPEACLGSWVDAILEHLDERG